MSTKPGSEFKWLLKRSRPLIWLYLASFGCIILSSLSALLDPLIMKWLIDDVLAKREGRLLPVAAIALLAAYIARLLFSSLGGLLASQATQKMVFKMRLELLRHIHMLPARYHENKSAGDTQHRLEQDIATIGEVGGDLIPACLRLIVLTTFIVTTMMVLNFKLTCVVLPLFPAYLYIRRRYYGKLRDCSDQVQKRSGSVSSFLQEHLGSIIQTQLLQQEVRDARRFASLTGKLTQAQIKRRKAEIKLGFLSMSVAALCIVLILAYGGYQVIYGALSVGGLVAFYSYVIRLFEPLGGAVDISSRLHRVNASVRRVLDILETPTSIKGDSNAVMLMRSAPGDIEFKNVSFEYCPNRPVLSNVSFRVEPGERIALIGASGSGKSTVAKLISRLYDVCDGSILIDQEDVRGIKLKSLRSSVALMTQEPVLFNATLRENVLYGNRHATQRDLDEVAERAQLTELIRSLKEGWGEQIGPRGSRLSGGERQRVALARTMLRRSRILILDEPTSSVDVATEIAFLEMLDRFTRGITTVIISHRPSTILKSDRIITIDHNRVIEASGGFFADPLGVDLPPYDAADR
ncbi:MAG TPA: ABC transporter ATP-binding protein [Blastocatellia bacterium]|nr:ABC transporter ATP-binding protein [Blastocatellia bacterium]